MIDKKLNEIVMSYNQNFEYKENINLRTDLNMDSLDIIKFFMELEEVYEIEITDECIDKNNLLNLDNLNKYLSNK